MGLASVGRLDACWKGTGEDYGCVQCEPGGSNYRCHELMNWIVLQQTRMARVTASSATSSTPTANDFTHPAGRLSRNFHLGCTLSRRFSMPARQILTNLRCTATTWLAHSQATGRRLLPRIPLPVLRDCAIHITSCICTLLPVISCVRSILMCPDRLPSPLLRR